LQFGKRRMKADADPEGSRNPTEIEAPGRKYLFEVKHPTGTSELMRMVAMTSSNRAARARLKRAQVSADPLRGL
jgi:hypothetical protein